MYDVISLLVYCIVGGLGAYYGAPFDAVIAPIGAFIAAKIVAFFGIAFHNFSNILLFFLEIVVPVSLNITLLHYLPSDNFIVVITSFVCGVWWGYANPVAPK